jgi:hypothetical protein
MRSRGAAPAAAAAALWPGGCAVPFTTATS